MENARTTYTWSYWKHKDDPIEWYWTDTDNDDHGPFATEQEAEKDAEKAGYTVG